MMIIRQGIPSASAFGQLVGRLVIFDRNEVFELSSLRQPTPPREMCLLSSVFSTCCREIIIYLFAGGITRRRVKLS